MNFKKQLEAELSRKNTDYIVHAAGNDPAHFHALMQIILNNEEPYSSRAAWVIDVICEKHITLIYPYISEIITQLPLFHHYGTCRHMLRILEKVSIPDEHAGKLIDYCFEILCKTEIPVAIKVFGMQIIANYTKRYPELGYELKNIIEDQWNKNSPGFQSRGKKILKNLSFQ